MLKQVNALPCAKGELSVMHRNTERGRQKGGFDVAGHIIGALIGVGEIGHFRVRRGRHEPVEKGLQVGLHLWVCVFLNEQASGGVADEQSEQAGAFGKGAHLVGELV